MAFLAGFVRYAEAVNDYIGRVVAWLTLATVIICATVVVLRYAWQTGFVWMQELYVWTHAAAFMLGAGYTLMADKHVRVDIVYGRARPETQAWLDLLSTFLFLFPWIGVLLYFGWTYMIRSWQLWETSSQVGGMPGLFVLKTIMMVFAGLMLLQGLAICARSILIINKQDHLAPRRQIAGLGE